MTVGLREILGWRVKSEAPFREQGLAGRLEHRVLGEVVRLKKNDPSLDDGYCGVYIVGLR